MILVDSSVWIDFFRGNPTVQADKLDCLLGNEPLAIASEPCLKEHDMQYLAVFEAGPTSYGACVPDLPGCIADGAPNPEPSSPGEPVAVEA